MHRENDPMYTAKLLGYKYRKQVVYLKESVDRRAGPFAVEGVEMGFDTGCDLTWFTPEVFSRISHTVSSVHNSCDFSFDFVAISLRSAQLSEFPITQYGHAGYISRLNMICYGITIVMMCALCKGVVMKPQEWFYSST